MSRSSEHGYRHVKRGQLNDTGGSVSASGGGSDGRYERQEVQAGGVISRWLDVTRLGLLANLVGDDRVWVGRVIGDAVVL